MNSTCELDVLIYKHFGTRGKLANAIGVHRATVQRWYATDPRKLLYYSPELVQCGVDQNELVQSVKEREARVKAASV